MPPVTVTMLEFRKRAAAIVEQVRRGQSVVLTYRGEPAVRLEPMLPERIAEDDAFYQLTEIDATSEPTERQSLGNREIDRIIYGK
jgi:prevent-host-death family protein